MSQLPEDRIDVLHLRACNFVGGPERQLLRYAGYERDGGIRLAIGSFVDHKEGEGRELLAAAAAAGVETLTLAGGGLRDVQGLAQLIAFLRRRRVRLLCTHAYRSNFLGLVAARACGLPIAFFLRGWTAEDWKIRAFEVLDRRIMHHANAVVCLSHMQAERIAAMGIESTRLHVVPNAVVADPTTREEAKARLAQRFQLSPETTVVAVAGRLSPEKGAADFLAALRLLPAPARPTTYLLFGDGPLREELAAQCRSLAPLDVRLAGFHPDFPSLVPGIDLLVNPSHREEMPNVVMEAMAAGVPVLATAVGGVAEIAGEPPAVAMVPPQAPASLAQHLQILLSEPRRRAQLAMAGKCRIEAEFSPGRQRASLRALYAHLVPGLVQEHATVTGG